MSIDHYLRAEVQRLRVPASVIAPSSTFAGRVVNHIAVVEKQRRARINIFFALIALSPYALRQGWSLIRGDFVSVASLPLAHAIQAVYGVFMSSLATYVLIAGGIVFAVYVVGLPKWHRA